MPKDEAIAVEWIQNRARQGDPHAQNLLGILYELGKGVPRDEARAFEWFKRSAEQGVAKSQQQVGFMYAMGKGVPRSDVEAYVWLTLAAEKNLAEAGVLRDAVEKHMTAEDKAEAQKLTAKVFARVSGN